jgi:hypothetical protein
MKKILLIFSLILLCALFTAIGVKAQVSSWRSNPPSRVQSSPSIQGQRSDVSMWRNQSPREFNRPQPTKPGSNIIVTRPWGWNNWGWGWNNWGWYQPIPYIWYDDFGWRQRSIIRVYEDGKRDTIARAPIYFTAGIGHTNNKQAAFWGAIGGKKGYFIMDYVMTYDIDRNQYYPNGNLAIADFPVSDELFRKEGALYLGGGKRYGKLGVHGMIGFGNEILRYQGRDALGGISFPKSNTNFTTFKVGIIRDFKFFTLKLDTDPIRGYSQLSIGLNNK